MEADDKPAFDYPPAGFNKKRDDIRTQAGDDEYDPKRSAQSGKMQVYTPGLLQGPKNIQCSISFTASVAMKPSGSDLPSRHSARQSSVRKEGVP